MAYYKVTIRFEQLFEVLVKADNAEQAKEKAKETWGEDDAIYTNLETYDIVELGEKHGTNK